MDINLILIWDRYGMSYTVNSRKVNLNVCTSHVLNLKQMQSKF